MNEPQFIRELVISALLIASTTFVHGVFVATAAAIFRSVAGNVRGIFRYLRDSFALVFAGMWLMAAHLIEIGMWAATFLHFDLFQSVEPSLYFAAASYTTLGFGDILLPEDWRLLSGAAAANGLLLFGLSAAFLFDLAGNLKLGTRH